MASRQNDSSELDNKANVKNAQQTDELDPYCNPENPVQVKFPDISAAAFKIRGGVERTPCAKSKLSEYLGMEIFFKKEFLQFTGSFKERGARNVLKNLNKEQRSKGVIAASAGNHALAMAYHGQSMSVPVTVVMPIIAPLMKVQQCRHYQATVIIHGADICEAKTLAMKMAKEKGMLYVNGYDHPHILAGQGTVGLEICEQVTDIDAVLVPVGGGGLIAGVAEAVKMLSPNTIVIGVESENCASFTASMKAGKPVYTKVGSTLADGLAVPLVGVNAYATAAPLIDKMVVVSEEYIALSLLRLVEMEKAVVEGAGATGLAAILQNLLPELKGKRVVVPLCGGNIDTTVLGRVIERGLAVDGRLCCFKITISDRPGGLTELMKLISDTGASIKNVFQERAWLFQDVFSVEAKVIVEARDFAHTQQVEALLRSRYKSVRTVSVALELRPGLEHQLSVDK